MGKATDGHGLSPTQKLFQKLADKFPELGESEQGFVLRHLKTGARDFTERDVSYIDKVLRRHGLKAPEPNKDLANMVHDLLDQKIYLNPKEIATLTRVAGNIKDSNNRDRREVKKLWDIFVKGVYK